jgi:predicted ATP-grasp superfamily ATP-dependent carboligase
MNKEIISKDTPKATDPLEVELEGLVDTAKDIEESLKKLREKFRESLKRLENNIDKSKFLKSS